MRAMTLPIDWALIYDDYFRSELSIRRYYALRLPHMVPAGTKIPSASMFKKYLSQYGGARKPGNANKQIESAETDSKSETVSVAVLSQSEIESVCTSRGCSHSTEQSPVLIRVDMLGGMSITFHHRDPAEFIARIAKRLGDGL